MAPADEDIDTRSRALILTALREEYRAARSHLTEIREVTHPQGSVYEIGEFRDGQGRVWDVAIAEVGAGNIRTAAEAERAIAFLKPTLVMFIGIAGGIKDVAIGDVVAATKVYGYESGKAGITFQPRPAVRSSTYRMEQRAKAEAKKTDWLRRITPRPKQAPRAFVGPIAAGEKVIASRRSSVYKFLKSSYGDALAVEMEGIGFMDATWTNHNVEAMVIRGISDLPRSAAEGAQGGYPAPCSALRPKVCREVQETHRGHPCRSHGVPSGVGLAWQRERTGAPHREIGDPL